MPISWAARMIRSAISPRFATRIRRNGGFTGASASARRPVPRRLVFAQRQCRPPGRAGAPAAPSLPRWSQRDVAVLLARIRVPLVGKHLERADESRARLGRDDHIVDVSAGGRDIWGVEAGLVLDRKSKSLNSSH